MDVEDDANPIDADAEVVLVTGNVTGGCSGVVSLQVDGAGVIVNGVQDAGVDPGVVCIAGEAAELLFADEAAADSDGVRSSEASDDGPLKTLAKTAFDNRL